MLRSDVNTYEAFNIFVMANGLILFIDFHFDRYSGNTSVSAEESEKGQAMDKDSTSYGPPVGGRSGVRVYKVGGSLSSACRLGSADEPARARLESFSVFPGGSSDPLVRQIRIV